MERRQQMAQRLIEEMARTLCGEKEHTCEKCDSCAICEFWFESRALYDAGYRKPRVGEWKEFSDKYGICATEFVCSKCKAGFVSSELTDKEFLEMMKFCPNCGADMKGGKEQ